MQERNRRKEYLALLVRLHGESEWHVSQECALLISVEHFLTLESPSRSLLQKARTSYAEAMGKVEHGAPGVAAQLFEEAWRAHRQATPQHNSPTLCRILAEWAAAKMHEGDPERARTLRSEAADMIREVFGDNHPAYGAVLLSIARCNVRDETDREVECLLRKVQRIVDEAMGSESDMAEIAHSYLVVLYNTRRRFAEAKAEVQQAESVLQRQLPENYVDSACNYLQLGKACAGLKAYDEAARAFQRAWISSTPSNSCQKSNDIANSSPSTPLSSATSTSPTKPLPSTVAPPHSLAANSPTPVDMSANSAGQAIPWWGPNYLREKCSAKKVNGVATPWGRPRVVRWVLLAPRPCWRTNPRRLLSHSLNLRCPASVPLLDADRCPSGPMRRRGRQEVARRWRCPGGPGRPGGTGQDDARFLPMRRAAASERSRITNGKRERRGEPPRLRRCVNAYMQTSIAATMTVRCASIAPRVKSSRCRARRRRL